MVEGAERGEESGGGVHKQKGADDDIGASRARIGAAAELGSGSA